MYVVGWNRSTRGQTSIQRPNSRMKLTGGIIRTIKIPNVQTTIEARIGIKRKTVEKSNFSGKRFAGDKSSK